jgi:hypothetical protein
MKMQKQSRSALRSPYDFDRQDGSQMECEYFKSFRYLEPEVRFGNITHSDSPDFRVDMSDRVIGVEVIQLFKRQSGRDVESTQDRILEKSCQRAQERRIPPAHVTLFFTIRGPLDGAARSRIADAVVRVIAEQMPADGKSVELEQAPGQPREVDLILINRVHCRAPGRWSWLEFSTFERDVAGIIQERIASKAQRLSTYLEHCSECWLLLVADSFRASGKLAFDDNCQLHGFDSPFARTYILDFGKGRLHRLRATRTTVP